MINNDPIDKFLFSLSIEQLDTLPQNITRYVQQQQEKKQAYELRKLKRSGAVSVTASKSPSIVTALKNASDLGYDISGLLGDMSKYMRKSD